MDCNDFEINIVVKFEANAFVITLSPPFKMPSFANVVNNDLDNSTASFFVILESVSYTHLTLPTT